MLCACKANCHTYVAGFPVGQQIPRHLLPALLAVECCFHCHGKDWVLQLWLPCALYPVCFQNADGKGILNTRPCYDSAPFAITEPGVDKPQTAYTKVSAQRVADLAVHAAKTRHLPLLDMQPKQDTSLCCTCSQNKTPPFALQLWASCSLCSDDHASVVVQTSHAVLEGTVSVMWRLKP